MNHSMESFNDTINYNGLLISIEKRPVSFQKHQSRWFVLVFACILLIGDYFCYDNPSALQDSLQSEIGLSTSQVNWLYTIYSIPNIVLPFFGGLFMDKKGLSRICFFFHFMHWSSHIFLWNFHKKLLFNDCWKVYFWFRRRKLSCS